MRASVCPAPRMNDGFGERADRHRSLVSRRSFLIGLRQLLLRRDEGRWGFVRAGSRRAEHGRDDQAEDDRGGNASHEAVGVSQ